MLQSLILFVFQLIPGKKLNSFRYKHLYYREQWGNDAQSILNEFKILFKALLLKTLVLCSFLLFTTNLQSQDSKKRNVEDYIQDFPILVNKTQAERTILLTPFYGKGINTLDSIQLFAAFEKIDALAAKNKDIELALETELMRAHYYVYRKYFQKDFVVNKIKEVDKMAKAKKVLWLEARSQSLLANYLYGLGEYGLGFEHFERTAQLLENIADEDFPLKQICLFQLAQVYIHFKEYENAIPYLTRAKDVKSPINSSFYKTKINNMLGFSYRKLKQLDSSFVYFKKNLQNAVQKKDSVWIGISSGNIGENYFIEEQFDKAQPLLALDLRIAKKREDWPLASNAAVYLSYIELENGNLVKAKDFADQALQFARKNSQYHRREIIYKLLSKIASYQSKPLLASKYLDSAFIVKDSVVKLFDSKKIIRAKQRIQLEKDKLEEEKMMRLNKQRIWNRNRAIIFLVIILLIISLLYNRHRLLSKNKAQQLLAEKQIALEKLESASKRMEDFKESLFNKSALIEKLEEEMSTVIRNQDSEVAIKELENSTLLTDRDWRKFVELFEQIHNGFFGRLRDSYPDLTPAEIRFMALIRLQLSNKEMMLMLGVGDSSIRQTKRRVLKKISVPNFELLQNMIATL